MAVTLNGTSITFNDSTVQTTAATAPTTAQVLSATAGASVGAVGTYAFLQPNNTSTYAAGSTISGSSCLYAGALMSSGGASPPSVTGSGTPSGTWRCMGHRTPATFIDGETSSSSSLWLRIS